MGKRWITFNFILLLKSQVKLQQQVTVAVRQAAMGFVQRQPVPRFAEVCSTLLAILMNFHISVAGNC